MAPHLKVTNCHVEESHWKVIHQNVKMIISGYWKHKGFLFSLVVLRLLHIVLYCTCNDMEKHLQNEGETSG